MPPRHLPRARTIDRRLTRNIPLLAANEFFAELRFYMPVAVLVFQSITGSYTAGMSVFAVVSFMLAIFEIPTGVLSDKWGRRNTLIVGSVAELAAVACYAAAPSLPHSLWMLYLGATFYGFAGALFSGNNHAMVYETLIALRRTTETGKALGRISSLGQAGLALSGVAAMAMLWMGMSYQMLMILSLGSLIASITLSLFTIEPPQHYIKEDHHPWQHMKTAFQAIVKNPKLRLLSIASMIRHSGGESAYYFTPSFIDSVWPSWLTPLYRTLQHSLGAAGFWFAGLVMKRFGALKVLTGVTIIGDAFALAAYALASVFSPVILMSTQLFYALYTTAERTVQQENFTDQQRSTMGSIISFGGQIAMGLASLGLGLIADTMTPAAALIVVLVFRSVIVNSIYWKLYKRHR